MGKLKHWNISGQDKIILNEKLSEIGEIIQSQTAMQSPSTASILAWDNLIKVWVEDKNLPLYVRKFNEKYPRGSVVKHYTGRDLIPCDNGPAHWAYGMCLNDITPKLEGLRDLISNDLIPIAFILKKFEKTSKFTQTKHNIEQFTEKGWKIAHIDSIGLKSKTPLENLPIKQIEDHFKKFLSPSNIFIFPKELAGLAEIETVIDTYKKHLNKNAA